MLVNLAIVAALVLVLIAGYGVYFFFSNRSFDAAQEKRRAALEAWRGQLVQEGKRPALVDPYYGVDESVGGNYAAAERAKRSADSQQRYINEFESANRKGRQVSYEEFRLSSLSHTDSAASRDDDQVSYLPPCGTRDGRSSRTPKGRRKKADGPETAHGA